MSGARSVAEGEKNLRGVRGFFLAGVIFAWSWVICLAVRKIRPNRGGRALASRGRPVGVQFFAKNLIFFIKCGRFVEGALMEMTMKFKNFVKIAFGALMILALASCATKVNVRMTRPAQLDLNGAETISVLPFVPFAYYNNGINFVLGAFFGSFDRAGGQEKKALNYLKSEIESGLVASPYITLVSSSAVQAAIKNGTTNPADVYLTGQVTNFSVYDDRQDYKRKIKDGYYKDDGEYVKPVYVHEDQFSRRVELDFLYQVVDSGTDKILSYKKVSISDNSSYYDDPKKLPSAFSVIQYDLSRTASKILRELQPYQITKTIRLLEYKGKPKNPDFKYAENLADDGYVSESYDEFTRIYNETGMMEAGYNAAMLKMALGNLEGAEVEMSALYEKFNDEKVLAGLKDIKNEIYQANRLKQQTEKSDVLEADF